MIVRIAGEGRWHLDDRLAPNLRRDQARLERAVDEQHDDDYRTVLDTLCRFVCTHGHALSSILGAASVTIPSTRMSLAQAKELLAGSPRPANGERRTANGERRECHLNLPRAAPSSRSDTGVRGSRRTPPDAR